MAVSAAVAVGSFSVVLAQSFGAVAASTLVPATFLTLVRAAKGVASGGGGGGGAGGGGGSSLPSTETVGFINDMLGSDKLSKALNEAAKAVTDIDLLVPKTAKITAEFEFEATDAVSADVSAGALVKVVSISAGYSALYTSTARNKINLEVDFVSVNYVI